MHGNDFSAFSLSAKLSQTLQSFGCYKAPQTCQQDLSFSVLIQPQGFFKNARRIILNVKCLVHLLIHGNLFFFIKITPLKLTYS